MRAEGGRDDGGRRDGPVRRRRVAQLGEEALEGVAVGAARGQQRDAQHDEESLQLVVQVGRLWVGGVAFGGRGEGAPEHVGGERARRLRGRLLAAQLQQQRLLVGEVRREAQPHVRVEGILPAGAHGQHHVHRVSVAAQQAIRRRLVRHPRHVTVAVRALRDRAARLAPQHAVGVAHVLSALRVLVVRRAAAQADGAPVDVRVAAVLARVL
mmetsp:Transcript_45018/g.118846  ORF Transcript_45018/g.118846 Transcript_45018/m.118846 type:complete len:211 (-) Transcript_45018:217-849(-)